MTRVNLSQIAHRDSLRAREDAQRADSRDARAEAGECPGLRWWDTTDDTDIPSAELLDGDGCVVASIHRERLGHHGGFDYAVVIGGEVVWLAQSWGEAKDRAEEMHAESAMREADRLADEVAW